MATEGELWRADPRVSWGWQNRAGRTADIHWVPGLLEESYQRVSRDGGDWILVSSVPVSAYHAVMADQRARAGEDARLRVVGQVQEALADFGSGRPPPAATDPRD